MIAQVVIRQIVLPFHESFCQGAERDDDRGKGEVIFINFMGLLGLRLCLLG